MVFKKKEGKCAVIKIILASFSPYYEKEKFYYKIYIAIKMCGKL